MTSSNNIIDFVSFRKKREEENDPDNLLPRLEQFIEAYHEAGPEATDMFNRSLMLFKAYGFDVEEISPKDLLLLRETMFSIILRYREQHHPLHTFAEEFDKYFSGLEYFLESSWVEIDDDLDCDQLDTDEDEPL